MAASLSRTPATPIITVRITPTLEREFIRRDVFQNLRVSKALKIISGATGVFEIEVPLAEELLADISAQRARRELLPKGMLVAYNSLESQLKDAIKYAKGLWDDPGIETACKRSAESPARFQVGEQVRFWSPFVNDKRDGARRVITGGYELRSVPEDDGAYVQRDGSRVSYRWGYTAENPATGETFFYPAAQLQSVDYVRGHLRLAASDGVLCS
jgi:hypothetical protein